MLSLRGIGLACLPLVVVHGQYQIAHVMSGPSFFDTWNFYNNVDNITNGDAFFVSQPDSLPDRLGLAFINDAGNAIIKVDNTTTLSSSSQKRNSVRIASTSSYSVGSLWIADIAHLPYGCSAWPAWWSQASNGPQGGEIHTFEGVNQVSHNQISLHTSPGCVLDRSDTSFTGTVNSTNCSASADSDQGCVVTDPRTLSYGADFAQSGGGVFVTEFAAKGISIWFFPRSAVPDSVHNDNGSIDTSTLGTPVANYSSEGCNTTTVFQPQQLILDITLCGDVAGNATVFAETCSGTCSDDVIGPPSAYDNAYFEIKSINTYLDPNFSSNGATGSPTIWNFRCTLGISALAWLVALM
ncbi:glycoside hydrolase family 16 protein [Ramaria rubella]|nr:glycoside hydrolase family 16 protein [Ramaria rubella]